MSTPGWEHHGSTPEYDPAATRAWAPEDFTEPGEPRSHRRGWRSSTIVVGILVTVVVVMGAGAYAGSQILGTHTGPAKKGVGTAASGSTVAAPQLDSTTGEPTSSASPSPSPSPSPSVKASPAPSVRSTRTTAPPATGDAGLEAQVFTLVNQERAKVGCPALTVDSRLATAARGHSQDMATRGFFDHTNPDGVTAAQRVKNAGYNWSYVGENIAAGQRTAADVMDSWMKSQGHRDNILNCNYKNIGVGVAHGGSYGIYWTQDFGRPA